MRVMARSGSKTATVVLTREHEIYRFLAWKRFGASKEMERSQPPIYTVEPQVLRKPVVQLILLRVQALDVFDMRVHCKLWRYALAPPRDLSHVSRIVTPKQRRKQS